LVKFFVIENCGMVELVAIPPIGTATELLKTVIAPRF